MADRDSPGVSPPADPSDPSEAEAEVMALFRQLPGDLGARDQLVERFSPLATYLARRFAGRGEDPDDLAQVASIGLLNAIDRYDVDRGVQFSSYAAATIIGELKRHFRDKRWALRVPRNLQEMGLRIHRVTPSLTQQLGRSPTIGEIATELDVSRETVMETLEASEAYSSASLDMPIGASGLTPGEFLGADDPRIDLLGEGWSTVAEAIKGLPQRDRTVLFMRFFEDKTQSEIASEVGVSQMHVSRILARALDHLRAGADGFT